MVIIGSNIGYAIMMMTDGTKGIVKIVMTLIIVMIMAIVRHDGHGSDDKTLQFAKYQQKISFGEKKILYSHLYK